MKSVQQKIVVRTKSNEIDLIAGTSLWHDAWKRLRKNTMALSSGVIMVSIGVACLCGPAILGFLWGYDAHTQNLAYGPQPPSLQHPFGTDFYGRDLLVRVLTGARVSLSVGVLAALVAASIGTIYGAVSSYNGGLVDSFMMRIVDILYALPYMFLVIILVTILGKSLLLLFLALGAVGWLLTARVVRGQVMSLKEQDFVLAARSLGTTSRGIIFRHLIPNTLGPVIVTFTLTVPSMILQEAFLSFLGLGVQPPQPSLGSLINDGANQMLVFWWTLVFPGGIMALMLFALNFLGDGIRDALDPRMKI
ncbi:MAG: ABC transporter permease [Pirellulales bacterium]|jgi:oligopeptide transport system permease protein